VPQIEVTAIPTRAAASGIGRKRDRLLVDSILRHAGANGGKLTPGVAAAALNEVWTGGRHSSGHKPATAMEIICKKLSDPNIRAAIGDIYDEVASFTIVDALKLHVKHIQGSEETGPPKYAALKDYMNMTIPQPAKKIEMGFVAGIGASLAASVPPVAARALGPAVVEDAPEAVDVEFSDDDES
jgi:hypothetical protein